MTTTITTAASTAPDDILTADTFPPFAPQAAGEGWSDYGVRAARYILTHGLGASYRLEGDALNAAGDVLCSPYLVGKDVAPATLARYVATQRACRTLAAQRRADMWARLSALVDASEPAAGEAPSEPAEAASEPAEAPSDAGSGQGGGGAKVPRRPRPKGPAGGGYASPDESGQAGSWRLPALDLSNAF